MPFEVSGSVGIRPIRVGLVFEPTLVSVTRAVECATSSWGGIYYPFIDGTDREQALRVARQLDVDVLHAVDDNANAELLSRLDGYSWHTGGEWGNPFAPGSESYSPHLQGVDWIYDEYPDENKYAFEQWDPSHPLNFVFCILYGRFGEDSFSQTAAAAFKKIAYPSDPGATIADHGRWPYDPRYYSPIDLTGREIEYLGEGSHPTVVVLEAEDAKRLGRLWTIRATGSLVIPWVKGHEATSLASLSAWLETHLPEGVLGGWRTVSGHDAGPHLIVDLPRSESIPVKLNDYLEAHKVEPMPTDHGGLPAHGWRGDHPFRTDFRRVFRVQGTQAQTLEVPLPAVGNARWTRRHKPGYVMADLRLSSVRNLAPDRTLALPAIRELAALMDRRAATDQLFHRPVDEGFAVAVRADADFVSASPVRSLDVFSTMAASPGWSYRQSDNGRFSSRLIDRMGGRASHVANQPAMRTVLQRVASSHGGQPLRSLVGLVKRDPGAWPHLLMRVSSADYPKEVVRFLIARKIIHPVLPVRCIQCSAEVALRPEDLKSDHHCDLCGADMPLGLPISENARNDWLYRLAAEISPQRLTETLPAMAVLSVLYSHARSGNYPFLLGLEVDSPTSKFEVDIVVVLDGSDRPTVVVGEVKNHGEPIDSTDIKNLTTLQAMLRQKGIDCYILAATFQRELPDETVSAIRLACEKTPRSIGPRVLPVMPIVLTGKNLSVPDLDDNHPAKWHVPGEGLSSVAVESCRRNLGLVGVELNHRQEGHEWVSRWT